MGVQVTAILKRTILILLSGWIFSDIPAQSVTELIGGVPTDFTMISADVNLNPTSQMLIRRA
ncbi:MAG: hypothetical protein R3330_13190, partial [Saprospiraceae bacterium]|nr:hypothetical protein [Saprospiraceae bacterium]